MLILPGYFKLTFRGAGPGTDQLYGDTGSVSGSSSVTGGPDEQHGGDEPDQLYGDVDIISGVGTTVTGGDDRQYGGDGDDLLYGDVQTLLESAIVTGGDDTINGDAGDDTLYGDAQTVSATATLIGGSDTLNGGDGLDTLYGDAQTLSATSIGGNDNLIGGRGADTMYGDGQYTYTNDGQIIDIADSDWQNGGDDKLNTAVGGKNPVGTRDTVWGNSGADFFIVGNNRGSTDIMDYNPDEGDRILGNTGLQAKGPQGKVAVLDEQQEIEEQLNTLLVQ